MKHRFFLAVFLASIFISGHAVGTSAEDAVQRDDLNAIDQLFRNYLDLLNKDDMDAIASTIYRPPVYSLNVNKIYETSADLATAWKAYVGKPREDGRKRTLESVHTCLLNNNIAISSVNIIVPTEGSEGTTKRPWFYTLQKADGVWRIVSLAPRDANLGFECTAAKK